MVFFRQTNQINMKLSKELITPLRENYIRIIFTLWSRKYRINAFFDLYGTITSVEDKNVEFKDNYNHYFIIPIARIKSTEEQTEPRRTEEEWQVKLIKEVNKAQETIRKKTKEIEDKEPLITLHS